MSGAEFIRLVALWPQNVQRVSWGLQQSCERAAQLDDKRNGKTIIHFSATSCHLVRRMGARFNHDVTSAPNVDTVNM